MSSLWMKPGKHRRFFWFPLLIAALVLPGTGCRFNDPSVDLLEGELRWMESQLYEMENNLEQACVDLSRCKADAQHQIEVLEEKASSRDSGILAPSPEIQSEIPVEVPGYEIIGGPQDAPTEIIMPDGTVLPDQPAYPIVAPTEPYALPSDYPIEDSPVILSEDDGNPVPTLPAELPAPVSTTVDDGEDPEPTRAELPDPNDANVPDRPSDAPEAGPRPTLESRDPGDDEAMRFLPPHPDKYSIRLQSHITSEPIRSPQATRQYVDAHITHIVIKAHQTARRSDGSGHDLEILVQPRNADGNYVSLPANLSVVVIDDNQSGDAARIARWDLDATEASRRFRKTGQGEGMHLEFDWPNELPSSDKLHMYVRYTTIDGRKLQSHQFLEPLGPSATPVDEQWKVVERTQPDDGWQVMTMPIDDAASVPASPPGKVIPASATTTAPIKESPAPKVISTANEWKTVASPAEPGRMPQVRTQPITKPSVRAIGSGVSRAPVSVPEWTPRR